MAWYQTTPRVAPPQQGARNGHDAVIAVRVVRAHFTIWGRTARSTENMVHAMIGAIDLVSGPSDRAVGAMSEEWAASSGDIVSGGVVCDLSFDLSIQVLESDTEVILSDAAPGDGADPETATGLVLGSDLDGASLPDVTTPPED